MAKHVAAAIGPAGTASCNAALPLVKDAGPVIFCLTGNVRLPANGYAFGGGIFTYDLMDPILRFFHAKGWHRIGLVTSTDSAGQDFERAFDFGLAHFNAAGATLVSREHFNPADLTVTAQLQRTKAAKPDVVIGWDDRVLARDAAARLRRSGDRSPDPHLERQHRREPARTVRVVHPEAAAFSGFSRNGARGRRERAARRHTGRLLRRARECGDGGRRGLQHRVGSGMARSRGAAPRRAGCHTDRRPRLSAEPARLRGDQRYLRFPRRSAAGDPRERQRHAALGCRDTSLRRRKPARRRPENSEPRGTRAPTPWCAPLPRSRRRSSRHATRSSGTARSRRRSSNACASRTSSSSGCRHRSADPSCTRPISCASSKCSLPQTARWAGARASRQHSASLPGV